MNNPELLARLNIELPIIQGPMAGGPSTPELIAAVSNSGGLGSLGAGYLTPGQITETIRQIRTLTSKPFQVNLFAGGHVTSSDQDPTPMLELLAEIHAILELPPPVAPPVSPNPFPAQLEAVLDAAPPIFSFTFGIPDSDAMARLRSRGILVIGTATTLDEARALTEAGVGAIIAQGTEAGAHRGTFLGSFEASLVPTMELVAAIHANLPTPVIAAGGLMDGVDIRVALRQGASAAALGTAFLASPESGAPEAHKRALLSAVGDTTVLTRAFSGRMARGLANEFIAKLAGREEIILPFPLQNTLTRAMRAVAAKRGHSGFLSLWAGTGVNRSRSMPAAALVETLAAELAG